MPDKFVPDTDDWDRILDDAVRSHSHVEPRVGIEARVMYRVRSARRVSRWRLLVSVLAAILIAVALQFRPTPDPMRRPVMAQAITPTPPTVISPAELPAHKKQKAHPPGRLPVKDVFPTPSPLTAEERAMVLLASRSPGEAQLLARSGEITPIKIPDLQIEPLQTGGN